MTVKLRLTRVGKKKNPAYRVVAADGRSPRDGRFIEIIGQYRPLEEPSGINIKEERALYWLSQGAQPSETVEKILKSSGIWEQYEKSRPKKSLVKVAARTKAVEAGRKKSADAHAAKKKAAQAQAAGSDDTTESSEAETTESE